MHAMQGFTQCMQRTQEEANDMAGIGHMIWLEHVLFLLRSGFWT